MKFENFNITLFRAFFGGELYELIRDVNFTFKVVNTPIKNPMHFSPAHVREVMVGGESHIVMEYNMHAVMLAAQHENRGTGERFKAYRAGLFVHEFAHVMQITNGRLKATSKGIFWEGKLYPRGVKSHWAYMSRPWETEAFVAGYTIMYGISEAEALLHHQTLIHRARPVYIKALDLVKSIFGMGKKNG